MSRRPPAEDAAAWLALWHELGLDGVVPRRPAGEAPPAARETAGGPAPSPPSSPSRERKDPLSLLPPPDSIFDDQPGSAWAAIREVVVDPDPERALARLRDDVIGDCRRCRLHEGRNKLVFGVGPATARLFFIGEGPGADEDRLGEPFVGRAGKLLDRILAAMGLDRTRVYIGNVVKCRPPGNRAPLPDEAETCLPFLRAQIAIVQPEVIVTLGRVALEWLLGEKVPSITRARGRWFAYRGIPVKATFHPAYLLRNPAAKRPVWEDMKDVLDRLGLPVPRRGRR